MITFLTIFLGLVTGVHVVELAVGDPEVVRIEVLLDGEQVAELRQPPWQVTLDLGPELRVRRLEARGFDREGKLRGSAVQRINVPRERSELEILLERDAEGRAVAGRLVWHSVDAAAPEALRVTFAGVDLPIQSGGVFSIPEYESTVPQLLQAELTAVGVTTRAHVVLGGGGSENVARELTTLLIEADDPKQVPTTEEIHTRLSSAGGEAFEIVAVEQPGADVVMVQDLDWTTQGLLNRLRQEMLAPRVAQTHRPTGLKSRDEFRIMFPIPEVVETASTPSVHFPQSPNLWAGQEQETFSRGAAQRQIATPIPQGLLVAIPVNAERRIDTSRQRLADAVAAAGVAVAGARRGRLVILVVGDDPVDESRATPNEVRRYLADLQVPLVVWGATRDAGAEWGDVRPVTNRMQLTQAIREVREILDRQVVVWLEGQAALGGATMAPSAMARSATPPRSRPSPEPEQAPAAAAAAATGDAQFVEAEAAGTGAIAGQLTEVSEVRLQTIELLATGPKGELVELAAEDLRLWVDGVEVPIRHLDPPDLGTNESSGEVAGARETDEPDEPEVLVVVFDAGSLPRAARARAGEGLVEALDSLSATTEVAVFAPKLGLVQPLSRDRAATRAAVSELITNFPLRGRSAGDQLRDQFGRVHEEFQIAHRIRDPVERQMAVERALMARSAAEAEVQVVAAERRREALERIAELDSLVAAVASTTTKGSVLYVGSGLSDSPAEDLFEDAARGMEDPSAFTAAITRIPEESRQSTLAAEARRFGLHGELDRSRERAAELGVAISAYVPFGIETTVGVTSSSPGAPGSQGRAATIRLAGIETAVCGLAEVSLGECVVGAADAAPAVRSLVAENRTYQVGFEPPHGADGKRHEVRLETTRPATQLRYRSAYLASREQPVLVELVVAALVLGTGSNPHGIAVHRASEPAASPGGTFEVELEVPLERLAPRLDPDGHARGELHVVHAQLDRSGRLAGATELTLRWDQPQAPVAGEVLRQRLRLPVVEGAVATAIGIWDQLGKLASVVRLGLD
jgi:hypothetical protein